MSDTVFSGPAYYESLNVFPNSTKLIVDVNLGNDTIQIARDELAAGIQHVGWERIRALECTLLRVKSHARTLMNWSSSSGK